MTNRIKVLPARRGFPCNMSLASFTGLARLPSALWMPFRAGSGTTCVYACASGFSVYVSKVVFTRYMVRLNGSSGSLVASYCANSSGWLGGGLVAHPATMVAAPINTNPVRKYPKKRMSASNQVTRGRRRAGAGTLMPAAEGGVEREPG